MKKKWAQLYCTLIVLILFVFIPGPAASAEDPLLIPMYSLLLNNSGPSISLVKDIYPGVDDDFYPEELFAWNGLLFFNADDGVHGKEVWMSDGTEAGTKMLKDINVGPDRSNGYDIYNGDEIDYSLVWDRTFTPMGGTLYFAATSGNHPATLWKSDGTADGTTEVYSVSPGNLTVFNGALYFTGTPGSDTELWKSDGTSEGTEIVKDISENYSSDAGGESGFTLFNNELYFSAGNTNTNASPELCGLWKTDGTGGGTDAVKPGTDLEPYSMAVCNNTLYFVAYDDTNSYDFWKSDGTSVGTEKLSNYQFSQAPSRFTEYNGSLYFVAEDGAYGRELWRLDCSSGTSTMVKDINPDAAGSNPQNLTVMGDTLYFKAEEANHGLELWKTDGTGLNTMMVKDINPGSSGSSIESITAYDGMLYFTADDGVHGDELWISDGTETGTSLLKDINPGADWSYPYEFTAMNGTLFFTATDATNGCELWKLKK